MRGISMKIFIATDVTVFKSNDKIYANQKHSTIFRRYYSALGSIVLCARYKQIDSSSEVDNFDDITEIIDSLIEIDTLLHTLCGRMNDKIKESINKCDFVICRCPAIAAYKAADIARKLGKTYLAESMGDPWDAYWNHGMLGKVIAPYMYLKMKNVVKHANYAIYVTKSYLQKRFPCQNKSIAASNVLIKGTSKEILVQRVEKLKTFSTRNITIMTTAAIDVPYKGQQYMIKAIPILNRMGIRVKYYIVGEGKPDYLKKVIKNEKVDDQVVIVGRLPLDDVLQLLDKTDIYIQPSLQEGLPRSVIEAMSRGCACIGFNTAGIPELIQPYMVVKRKSIDGIVKAIKQYASSTYKEKEKIATENWIESQKYTEQLLNDRRNRYFETILKKL